MYPKLVASPDYHGYITGEAVSLTCLVPEESRNESSVFYKDSNEIISQNNSTYNISRLDNSHVGLYMCVIWDRRSNMKAIHVYGNIINALLLTYTGGFLLIFRVGQHFFFIIQKGQAKYQEAEISCFMFLC